MLLIQVKKVEKIIEYCFVSQNINRCILLRKINFCQYFSVYYAYKSISEFKENF